MDQDQIRLVIEDMLRTDIVRDIGITHRSIGVSNGSKAITDWKQATVYQYHPRQYRLAMIKHFFFELRLIDSNAITAYIDDIQKELSDVRTIPPLDVTRGLYRVTTRNINAVKYWDNVFNVLLTIVEDKDWWQSLEDRVKCTNDK